MKAYGILSYHPLLFAKKEGGYFKQPSEFPAEALITPSTHDLPTLTGFWQGRDLALRTELHLFAAESVREAQVIGRAQDRARLLSALAEAGLLPTCITADPASVPEMTEDLMRAVHIFLARTPARIMMVQPEDILGALEQVNLPGSTADLYPNWRRKLTLPLERWPAHEPFLQLARRLAEVRG
jgi:(1->4)-alpha-D-glucan 1-alpha-D-glucosylmutase